MVFKSLLKNDGRACLDSWRGGGMMNEEKVSWRGRGYL